MMKRFPIPMRFPLLLLVSMGLAACATRPSATEGEIPKAQPASPVAPTAVPAPALRIMAVGDIMLDGTARPVLARHGYDYAFAQVKHFFAGAPIVVANLEGPLTTRGVPEQDKTYIFRSPPEKVSEALRNAGINVVSLANNHTLDFGPDGLADTRAALDAVGIAHMGAGPNLGEARRAVYKEVAGLRVALLGYSVTLPEHFYAGPSKPGTAFAHEAHVRADVTKARREADIVVVAFHWGQEGKTQLRDYQVQLGRAAIDAGASAVVGHHPHILQAVERYRDGVILYSLGNFTFGSYSKQAQVSAVAELNFDGSRLASVRLHPINVNNFEVEFQPRPLNGEAADRVVQELAELSALRQTTLVMDQGTAFLALAKTVSTR